jgi:hypothetical protein
MYTRSIIKYIIESVPFIQAPIVGSPKDFPVFPKGFLMDPKLKIKKAKKK